jgi:hypothetical protein
VWVVLAWWTAPRSATVERAQADIAAGKVAVYEWGQSWERFPVFSWGFTVNLRAAGDGGPLFVWRTPDWRTHYADLDDGFAQPDDIFSADMDDRLSPEAEAVRATVRSSVLATGGPLAGEVSSKALYLATVVGLVCLAILIAGPAPVIGTRWYWFWINAGIPLGLGTLAWLILERPWSARVAQPSEPGVEKRDRGYVGFLVAVVAAIALTALDALLPDAFGTWLIPDLPD